MRNIPTVRCPWTGRSGSPSPKRLWPRPMPRSRGLPASAHPGSRGRRGAAQRGRNMVLRGAQRTLPPRFIGHCRRQPLHAPGTAEVQPVKLGCLAAAAITPRCRTKERGRLRRSKSRITPAAVTNAWLQLHAGVGDVPRGAQEGAPGRRWVERAAAAKKSPEWRKSNCPRTTDRNTRLRRLWPAEVRSAAPGGY